MKAVCLQRNDIDTTGWNNLATTSPQGSAFVQSGYIDALLPDGWTGILVYDQDELQAVMPLNIRQKWGIKYALQPILAKYWGVILLNKSFNSLHKEYSWKKKVINAILDALPANLSALAYNFHPAFDYGLPFIWRSYALDTRYTYILDSHTGQDIISEYDPSLRNIIRMAEKDVNIAEDSSTENLVQVLETYRRSGKKILNPEYYKTLENIFKYGHAMGRAFSLTARGNNNQLLGSSLYVQDGHTVYALIHCMDKEHSKTNALSLMVHHAIERAAALGLKFDFLGSVIESVEAGNRKFNARPTPYLTISKKSRFVSVFGN